MILNHFYWKTVYNTNSKHLGEKRNKTFTVVVKQKVNSVCFHIIQNLYVST